MTTNGAAASSHAEVIGAECSNTVQEGALDLA